MESCIKTFLAAVMLLAMAAVPVRAHPHVFVTMAAELLYAADGSVTGIRHIWTFDESFSAMATMGLAQKEKGKFTRQELAPLAEINVTSLKEYDYFTFMKMDGKAPDLKDASDYYLSYSNEELTLHFTLMLKKPFKAKSLDLEVYDPSYMVDFKLAEKEPVRLTNAPASCKPTVTGPREMSVADGKRLSEQMFTENSSQNWGQQFASKTVVRCQ